MRKEFVTHEELDEAIAAVEQRIEETEDKLRNEFKSELSALDKHLDDQDSVLTWLRDQIANQNRAMMAAAIAIISALLYVALK